MELLYVLTLCCISLAGGPVRSWCSRKEVSVLTIGVPSLKWNQEPDQQEVELPVA